MPTTTILHVTSTAADSEVSKAFEFDDVDDARDTFRDLCSQLEGHFRLASGSHDGPEAVFVGDHTTSYHLRLLTLTAAPVASMAIH